MTRRGAAALAVAAAAFALYHATLLPGVDFGDTPSFQVMAGAASISPRDAYPLYFAIGDVVLWLRGGDPAHALNLASAIEAAGAAGVFVLVAVELSGSLMAGVAAAAILAGSYTFWSQAVIAEVYALHLLLVGLTLLALLEWHKQPSTKRLATFFAIYALSFGNHLTMILLLPAYTVFLLFAAPHGWRRLFTVRTVAMATLCAALGAMQYVWNLRHLWLMRVPPPTVIDGLRTFWFDITKADWRDTLILGLPRSMIGERWHLYAFDLQQQFGWAVPLVAIAGLAWLARRSPSRAVLAFGAFAVTFGFAFTYSVGDSHVFFLMSHFFLALLAACGVAWLGVGIAGVMSTPGAAPAASLAVLALAGYRIYDNYPALDRSRDDRPMRWLARLTQGLDDRRDILLVDLNWQVQNGLTYYLKDGTHAVAATRLADVLLYVPALIRDNRAVNRGIALSAQANALLTAAYGPLFSTDIDDRAPLEPFSSIVARLPPGTRYALTILKSTRDSRFDAQDFLRATAALTGGQITALPTSDYYAAAGLTGRAPQFVREANTPFRVDLVLDSVPVTLRMESWLAFDTIRRMGFGHVVARRQHTLIVERGVSFAAFDGQGRPIAVAYGGGIFAPEPRYRITRAMVEP